MPTPPEWPHRRLFAGGRTEHRSLLRIGAPAERRSTVVATTVKKGRSGPLTFVTVRHEYRQDGELAVVDEQDLVYRPLDPGVVDASRPQAVRSTAPAPLAEERSFDVDPVTLFLFSRATANAHRIHYDLDYARSEGHHALVIHGPLQVLLMAAFLEDSGESLVGATLEYRLVSPARGAQTLRIGRPDDAAAAVVDADGVRTAQASLVAR
jgi:3-methylfumaryl-CoA hydratase